MDSRLDSSYKDQFFDPKQENLAYTIAIVKPSVALHDDTVQDIIELIEKENFIIKSMLKRELIRQEVINLFNRHLRKDYFNQIL